MVIKLSYLHECYVIIMHAYEKASVVVSKPCYKSMCLSSDKPFEFNASLQHELVIIIHIVNSLPISSYFSLVFLFLFFSSFNLVLDYNHQFDRE